MGCNTSHLTRPFIQMYKHTLRHACVHIIFGTKTKLFKFLFTSFTQKLQVDREVQPTLLLTVLKVLGLELGP